MAEADPGFETRPEPPVENDTNSVTVKPKRRWKRLAIMISVPLLLLAGAGIY